MNYQAVWTWKVRKKHIIIWGIIVLAIVGMQVFSNMETRSVSQMVCLGVMTAFCLMWVLPPVTLAVARDGSVVTNFIRGVKSNAELGMGDEAIFYQESFDLNSAGDSFFFGLYFIEVLIRIFGALIKLGWKFIKYLICYLIIAVPFPFVTYYYYLRSRDKIKTVNVVAPIISFAAFLAIFVISCMSAGNEAREANRVAAENARKEAGIVRVSVDELDDYEGVILLLRLTGYKVTAFPDYRDKL